MNRGNRFEISVHSVFSFADPANIGKSLLDGNKDHLFNQARSELMKQEHQVESLTNCIDELQQQAYAQRLELEDAHHGYIESRREQSRLQEELSMKEKALRETQIGNLREMGEIKRAQELRAGAFSSQKLRESHETIRKLTYQLQEIQEQMNSMIDSGEFQEVESNHSGRLSYVPSQPAAIPKAYPAISRTGRSSQNCVFFMSSNQIYWDVVTEQERQMHHTCSHGADDFYVKWWKLFMRLN